MSGTKGISLLIRNVQSTSKDKGTKLYAPQILIHLPFSRVDGVSSALSALVALYLVPLLYLANCKSICISAFNSRVPFSILFVLYESVNNQNSH